MKYYGNYIDDAVVREDEAGNRYIKYSTELGMVSKERLAPRESKSAYGGISYGCYHLLEEIDKERYDTFGIKWVYE